MNNNHRSLIGKMSLGAAALALSLTTNSLMASSHMDAPIATADPAANTTDVYAFVSVKNGVKYLTTAVAVYPFEEPGIGPNAYNFDPNVLYQIHVATKGDLATGDATYSYRFRFSSAYKNANTIAQSYLGVINNVGDANQNLTQTYDVTMVKQEGKPGGRFEQFERFEDIQTVLFSKNLVPPNNQGLVTPLYNQQNNGNMPAKEGVAADSALDTYTTQSVYTSPQGYHAFAGQRDDGFYANIQSIFDLDFTFSGPIVPFDSQSGFNVHTIVLDIPVSQIGGDQQIVGVYATTSRPGLTVLRPSKNALFTQPVEGLTPPWVQVARQGNPLFCEALVANKDKDYYSQSSPTVDSTDFKKYALNPELAVLLKLDTTHQTNRTDLAGIFIPDLIKVDLSTGAAKLAGGINPEAAPDDIGFHRLGIFGGDTLHSTVQAGFGGGTVPGGWPNGRRFGDDVLDIAVLAVESDLRTSPPVIVGGPNSDVDKVTHNDIGYNKVFPYAATPQNGRDHEHN
jgi:hypothetical protein